MTRRDWIESWLLPRVAKPNRYIGNYRIPGPGPGAGASSGEPPTAETWGRAALRVLVLSPALFESGFADPLVHEVVAALHATAAAGPAGDAAGALLIDQAFCPWPDFLALVPAGQEPLHGLATGEPPSAFDLVVGVLQSPLEAAALVRCLPVRPPLLALIGPGVANPVPFGDLADATLHGDALACLPALIERLAAAPDAAARRAALAAGLPGVLPLPVAAGATVRAALCTEEAPHAIAPPQALVETEGDAIPLVLRRGGTARRFEAGPRTWLAPWHVEPEAAFRAVEEALRDTGADRVELVGDDPAEHPEIARLVEGLVRRHPGLRLTLGDYGWRQPEPSLARELLRGKRATFTWTPWAGTERLRRVLNVALDEERLVEAVSVALRGGCHMVRLRFGIGWPTETEDDLLGLAALVQRLKALGAQAPAPPRLQVLLEPFVPRPGTPLQWEAALTPAELEARVARVRRLVEQGPVQVRCAPAEQVALEAALLRAARPLGDFFRAAAAAGASAGNVAAPWDAAPWWAALATAGLLLDDLLAARAPGTPLPGDAAAVGLPPAALREERVRAMAATLTPPAERQAEAAAAVQRVPPPPVPAVTAAPLESAADADSRAFGRRGKRKGGASPMLTAARFRLRFAKDAGVRFTAHLDVGRWFERALRRLDLSVGGGRTRAVKLSFGPPLPLGMTGEDEYLDMQFTEEVSESFLDGIGRFLPPGVRLLAARPVQSSVESLSASITLADYVVAFPLRRTGEPASGPIAAPESTADGFFARLPGAVAAALARPSIEVTRGADSGLIDIRPALVSARLEPGTGPGGTPRLFLRTNLAAAGGGRPELLLPALCGEPELDPRLALIHRTALRISGAGREFSPLEVVELGFPWWRDTLRRQAAGG